MPLRVHVFEDAALPVPVAARQIENVLVVVVRAALFADERQTALREVLTPDELASYEGSLRGPVGM